MADANDPTPPKPKESKPKAKPVNSAPDAVMDPNEKTDGKPGEGPKGGNTQNDETDPGGG